jgi:hypothetical protein
MLFKLGLNESPKDNFFGHHQKGSSQKKFKGHFFSSREIKERKAEKKKEG